MKYLFTLLLLCLPLSTFAQSHYREGFVVTTAGDTLPGYIADNGEIESTKVCVFRSSPEGEKQTFLPGDVSAYHFRDHKKYVTQTIKTDGVDEKVFLECLIEGVVTVYYLKRTAQDRFFIVKNEGVQEDDGLQELSNHEKYLRHSDGVVYAVRSNQYRGILNNYFSDSPGVARQVNKASLRGKDLVALSEAYHQAVCSTERCTVYKKKFPKPAYYLGASATGGMQRVHYDPFYEKYADVNVTRNVAYGAGVSLEANVPRINEKLFLQFYAGYQTYAFEGVKYDFLSRPSAVDYHLEVLQTELSFLYRFRGKHIRPFAKIGAPIAFVIASEGFIRDKREGVSIYFPENAPLENNMYGIKAGAGLETDLGTRSRAFVALSYNKSISYDHNRLRFSGLWLSTGILRRAF